MEEYEIAQHAEQFVEREREALRVGEPGSIHNTRACLPAGTGPQKLSGPEVPNQGSGTAGMLQGLEVCATHSWGETTER